MRRAFIIFTAAFSATPLAAPAAAATVTLRVHGVATAKGEVLAEICDSSNFLKACTYVGKVPAREGDVVVRISNVPPGRYAAVVYHDENGNHKLDRNSLGIPLEGYGFSRDAKGQNAPPTFEAAAVNLGAGPTTLDVTLNY